MITLKPEQARRIARHHLGEHLRDVVPVGSGYNVLIHLEDGGYRGAFASEAEDLPAVCQEAASQLRATGWVPTHPRLEWEPESFGSWYLRMHFDAIRMDVAAIFPRKDMAVILGCVKPVPPWTNLSFHTKEKAAAHIAEWHASNLPTLHLPSFPEST